jgi:hypothetical protein
MKSLALFTCIYLLIALCKSEVAEIISQRFKVDPILDNKVSNISVLEEHRSQSLSECANECGDRCSCFGFNVQERRCRIHQTCDPAHMTTKETGWRYYSPAGMLSYIPYIAYIKCISCVSKLISYGI